jgi:hypothetical protein
MKKFIKTKYNLFICEECGKTYEKSQNFSHHINKKHSKKEYYDKWIKENDEGFCKICGKETKFLGFRLNRGYEKCCCKEHLTKYLYIARTNNNLEKYGVENVFQSDNIKEKSKKTKKERYGNENYLNIEKSKQTCIKKYGEEYAIRNAEVYNKMKLTNLEKYGVENVFQSDNIKEKSKKTSLLHYGVEYPSQNAYIHKKQQISGFRLKQFRDTNIYYRGLYELDFLNKYYNIFPDIINGPTIRYVFESKTRIYFPDFYIPSLNLIIEIKYSYYAKRDKKQIAAKKNSVILSGFKYIMIVDKNYSKFIKRIS